MSDFQVTPNLAVSADRALEWFQGIRPLPGQDAKFFFQFSFERGFLSREDATRLLRRHLDLERRETGTEEPEMPPEMHKWLLDHGWTPPGEDE